MADPQFWSTTAESFRRLQPPLPQPGGVQDDSHNGLCAHWRGEQNPEGVDPWHFSNAEEGTKKLFNWAAERAAVELGHGGGPSAVFFWLDLLKRDSPSYKSLGPLGFIYQVCNASAEYCLKLETDAKAAANAVRAAWTAKEASQQRPAAVAPGRIDELPIEFLRAIRANQRAEQAGPERRRKREKGDADYEAMFRRRLGMHVEEAERQEELLRSAQDHALTSLRHSVRKVRLRLPVSEADIEAACNEIRDEIVLHEWDWFRQQYKLPSDCRLQFKEFEAALWTEGFPSLEDRAKAAIRRRAAGTLDTQDSAEQDDRDAVAETLAGGTDPKQTERAKVRSLWLDQKLGQHQEWISDPDIAANGGPAYNTIRRYRSGRVSTRDLYVRRKFAKAFECEVASVPE